MTLVDEALQKKRGEKKKFRLVSRQHLVNYGEYMTPSD